MPHPTYRHTLNSNDVRQPLDGAKLFNIKPMGEEFYDKDETGPMFTAEAEGFDGVLHLFADEINNLPPGMVADWGVLAAVAERDHRAANERFYAAKEASEEAAFRQLIFSAASAGVVKMRISPSDQGDWMTPDWAEDANGEDMLDGSLDNDLHDGIADLPDQRNATWTRATGVTVEENSRHEIHMASIDVMAAAKALVDERQPAPEHPVLQHVEQICEDAGLGVMVQVYEIISDRGDVEDSTLLALTTEDVNNHYYRVGAGIDDVERNLLADEADAKTIRKHDTN